MFYVHATFCVLSTACCLMCIGSFLSLYRIRKDYGFLFFAFLNGCSVVS